MKKILLLFICSLWGFATHAQNFIGYSKSYIIEHHAKLGLFEKVIIEKGEFTGREILIFSKKDHMAVYSYSMQADTCVSGFVTGPIFGAENVIESLNNNFMLLGNNVWLDKAKKQYWTLQLHPDRFLLFVAKEVVPEIKPKKK